MGRSKIFGCKIYVERTLVIVVIHTSVGAHFTPDCFEANTGLIPGFKKRKMLKPTAVPTVFSFPTKYSVNKPRLSSVKQIKSREKRFEN